jgi:uncharacterized coiled-coil protein SlyX
VKDILLTWKRMRASAATKPPTAYELLERKYLEALDLVVSIGEKSDAYVASAERTLAAKDEVIAGLNKVVASQRELIADLTAACAKHVDHLQSRAVDAQAEADKAKDEKPGLDRIERMARAALARRTAPGSGR